MSGNTSTIQIPHVEVATLALRDAYPVGLRKWGMLITVTDDPTPANNITWELRKGFTDSDKSNNSNFRDANSFFPYTARSSSAGTSYSQVVVAAADIPDNSILLVTATILGIKSDGSEGYTGIVQATFKKVGGILSIIGVSTSTIVEDVTGSVTSALSVAANAVQLDVSLAAASGNFTQNASIELKIKTVA